MLLLARSANLPFPVSAFATSAQSRLHRCEHHAHLSACASVFGHTIRLQCQMRLLVTAITLCVDSIRTGNLSVRSSSMYSYRGTIWTQFQA